MKHRIYKNFQDEQDSNQDLRGHAIPYQINSLHSLKRRSNYLNAYQRTSHFGQSSPKVFHNTQQPLQLLPQLSNEKSQSINVHQALTPSSSSTKKSSQVTPGTSERKTLLAWLSSTKKTPQSSTLSTETLCSKSIERKKITLKRKLTDLIEEDENQENNYSDSKKGTEVLPPKSVLAEREDNILSTPSTSVAKVLKYDSNQCEKEKSNKETPKKDIEDNSSFLPLDEDSTISPGKSLFHNKSHQSLFQCRILTSPTANLPNYVIDGRSPHNRCKVPTPKKKRPDWLTSLRQQKDKSHREVKRLPENKSTPTQRRSTRQTNSKKCKIKNKNT